MLNMQGKNAIVFGVANKRSIAWAIAQSLSAAGARLAITYQNERLKQEAHDLIQSLPGAEAFQCDLSNDAEIAQLFSQVKERFGRLDALAHCVAHALAEDLKGDFLNTSRDGFRLAHDVSVYTLIAVTRAAAPLMTEGGSVVTLSYLGAERVVPGYNVMGVAKAALEATVRYLANSVWPAEDSRECHLGRSNQDTGCARRRRSGHDDEEPCRTRTVETQCRRKRSRRYRPVPLFRPWIGNYRRDHLRRLRL